MGRCERTSEKLWVDEVWGAPRRGEAGDADWGQVRECLARLPWEFVFHLVSREETTQGFQPEKECFVIKICTLKRLIRSHGGEIEWRRDSLIKSFVTEHLLCARHLSKCWIPEVSKTKPDGHKLIF